MIRIGFIGVPGAGKTTCARALAGCIRQKTNIKTVELVDEYARKYIAKYGIEGVADQMRILNKQVCLEDKYPSTTELIITDSPIFLGLGYAVESRREDNSKDTMYVNDLFKELSKLNEVPRYDIIFHLPPVNQPTKDGIRPDYQFDPEWREEANKRLLAPFYIFPPRKLITLKSSDTPTRIEEAIAIINQYLDKEVLTTA